MTRRRNAPHRVRVGWLAVACGVAALAATALAWMLVPRLLPRPDASEPAFRPAVSGGQSASEPSPGGPSLDDISRALGASAAEREAVALFYHADRADRVVPLWLEGAALTADGNDVRARLRAAARHGLDPSDYLIGPLTTADLVPAGAAERATYDAALSLGALRYMRHLHLGRVDPRAVGVNIDTWREPHAFPALLRDALAARRVGAALDALAPPFALYRQLLDALARYRALAARSSATVPPFTRAVKPGERYEGARELGVHLEALGDLAADAVPPVGATGYEGPLVDGVRRFQSRHGLTPDGALGAQTIAAARVPAAARARQIELALERLRWLPDLGARRLVAVNIPMFRLWAWDTIGGVPAPAFSSRVIVGAAATETPVFVDAMEYVIFRPYWNVPPSILRKETLPAMRRDPGYLASQDMEVVRGDGDDARPVDVGPDTLEALAAGALRVRQRPGPRNALGLVKFVFPNAESVYMHGTPAPALFARDRRAFSHGCIRVADPAGLAAWVLAGVPGWDAARIAAAMQASRSERVAPAAPIDVVLFYLTAAVLPEDGAVHFAPDIYGHDATLERALAQAQGHREAPAAR